MFAYCIPLDQLIQEYCLIKLLTKTLKKRVNYNDQNSRLPEVIFRIIPRTL